MVLALALSLAAVASTADAAIITVAGYSPNGQFAFSSGAFMGSARASLLNPANFGPAGTVDSTVTILPDRNTITAANLAGVDVLILSAVSPYTAAQGAVLKTFVQNGGSLLFYGDVGVNFGANANPLSQEFGITYSTDDFLNGPPTTINQPGHPVMQGPFGTSSLVLDASGSIVSQTNGLTVATISSGPSAGRGAIVVQDASTGLAGSGRVVWFTDTNILADNFGLYDENEILFLNTFAFAAAEQANPVPAPGGLALFAVGAVGLAGFARRRGKPAAG
jgi:hypothetical protein